MLHFARVLLELDLQKEKQLFIMYERSGHCSTVSIGYEQHPSFCTYCGKLGHSSANCSRQLSKPPPQTKAIPTAISGEASRLAKDSKKEWIRVGKKPSNTQPPPASSPTQDTITVPSTNVLVLYIAPIIGTHNTFSDPHISNDRCSRKPASTINSRQAKDPKPYNRGPRCFIADLFY